MKSADENKKRKDCQCTVPDKSLYLKQSVTKIHGTPVPARDFRHCWVCPWLPNWQCRPRINQPGGLFGCCSPDHCTHSSHSTTIYLHPHHATGMIHISAVFWIHIQVLDPPLSRPLPPHGHCVIVLQPLAHMALTSVPRSWSFPWTRGRSEFGVHSAKASLGRLFGFSSGSISLRPGSPNRCYTLQTENKAKLNQYRNMYVCPLHYPLLTNYSTTF